MSPFGYGGTQRGLVAVGSALVSNLGRMFCMCTLLVSLPTPALTTWLRTGCEFFSACSWLLHGRGKLRWYWYRSRFDIPPLQSAGPRKGESGSEPQVQDNMVLRHFARISASNSGFAFPHSVGSNATSFPSFANAYATDLFSLGQGKHSYPQAQSPGVRKVQFRAHL